jgi:hypothetical protein
VVAQILGLVDGQSICFSLGDWHFDPRDFGFGHMCRVIGGNRDIDYPAAMPNAVDFRRTVLVGAIKFQWHGELLRNEAYWIYDHWLQATF